MEWLKTILSVIVSFFIITLLFATVNGLELFSWEIMEKIWLFYLPMLSFSAARRFSRKILRPGGGIFAAFCSIAPPLIVLYYFGLPFADDLFRPLPIVLGAICSILGESLTSFLRKGEKKSDIFDETQENI